MKAMTTFCLSVSLSTPRRASRWRAAAASLLWLLLAALALTGCGGGGSGNSNGAPEILVPPQSETRVVGQGATLRVEAIGPDIRFEWQQRHGSGPWQPAAGTVDSTSRASELRLASVSLDQNETFYRALISNAQGQVASAEARLDVIWGVVETLEPNTLFDFGGGSEGFASTDGGSAAGGDGNGVGAGGGLGKTFAVRIALSRTLDATELGSALTGATSGLVRIKAGPGTAPALLALTGTDRSTYFDEGKGRLLPIGPDQQLHSLVTAFDQHLGITALSEAAYRYALNHFLVDPAQVRNGSVALQRRATAEDLKRLTPAQIQQAHDAILAEINRHLPARYQLVSVATLPTPVDEKSGRGTITNNRYGIMQAVTGGLAYAAGRFAPSLERPALTLTAQLADDLTDGVIDGKRLDDRSAFEGGDASYDPATFTRDLTAAADAQMEQYGDDSVVTAPTIGAQPESATITSGGTATLSVKANGSALSYQWLAGDAEIEGATGASHTTGTAGSYRVVVRNPSGSVTSAPATVTVTETVVAPTITSQPASATVDEGGSATLRVGASGTDLTYQWFRGDDAIATATGSSLTTGTAGTYHVVVGNRAGSVRSNDATLTVRPPAPVITTQPASVTITSGETATLTVQARGSSLSYQWYAADAAIPDATSSSYRTGTAGSYHVVVSNPSGSATSERATVTVTDRVVAPTITSQPESATVSEGSSATLRVGASGSELKYQWFRGDETIAGATGASHSTGTAGTYHVVVSNTAGSVRSNDATVTVTPAAPVITTQPESVTIVSGRTATLRVQARGTALTYQWRDDAGPIAGATAANYETGKAGNFRVEVRNGGGSVLSTVATVTVITAPVITRQPASLTVAQGRSGTFSVEASGISLAYQWFSLPAGTAEGRPIDGQTAASFTTSTAGTYYVVVTNPAGSVRSDNATLTVEAAPPTTAPPRIAAHPASATIKEGETHTFGVKAEGTGLGYQWESLVGRTWSAIEGATRDSYATGTAGTYRVVVRNSAGPATSDAATLTVTETRAPVITKQPESLRLRTGSGTFTVEASGLNLKYQWFFDNDGRFVAVSGATGASFTTDQAGTYRVDVSNRAGTAQSKTATLFYLLD
jgi:hypothetical protein